MPINEKELRAKMTEIISKLLPDIFREYNQNIKEGVIVNIVSTSSVMTADVKLNKTGQIINKVPISKALVFTNITLNDKVLLITPDQSNLAKHVIVAVF